MEALVLTQAFSLKEEMVGWSRP